MKLRINDYWVLSLWFVVVLLISSCWSEPQDLNYTVYHPVLQDKDLVQSRTGFFDSDVLFNGNTSLDNAGKIIIDTQRGKFYVIDYYKGIYVSSIENPSLDSIWSVPGIISFEIYGHYLYVNSAKNYYIFDLNTGQKVFETKDFFSDLLPPDYKPVPMQYEEALRPSNTDLIAWTADTAEIGDHLERYKIFEPFFVSDYFKILDDKLFITEKNYVSIYSLSNASKPGYENYLAVSDGSYVFDIRKLGDNYAAVTNTVTYIFDGQFNFVQSYIGLGNCMPFVYDSNKNLMLVLEHAGLCSSSNVMRFYDLTNIENPELDTSYTMIYPTDLVLTDSNLVVCDDKVRFYSRDSLPGLYAVDSLDISAIHVFVSDSVFVFECPSSIEVYTYPSRGNFIHNGSLPVVKTFID